MDDPTKKVVKKQLDDLYSPKPVTTPSYYSNSGYGYGSYDTVYPVVGANEDEVTETARAYIEMFRQDPTYAAEVLPWETPEVINAIIKELL